MCEKSFQFQSLLELFSAGVEGTINGSASLEPANSTRPAQVSYVWSSGGPGTAPAVEIRLPATALDNSRNEVASAWVLGQKVSVIKGPHGDFFAAFDFAARTQLIACTSYSAHAVGLSLHDFVEFLENLAPLPVGSCGKSGLAFRLRNAPKGFGPSIKPGQIAADSESEHEVGENKVFHVAGSRSSRAINIYRGEPLPNPAIDRHLIRVLETSGWLARSTPGNFTVDFWSGPNNDPCNYIMFASRGVRLDELESVATGLAKV